MRSIDDYRHAISRVIYYLQRDVVVLARRLELSQNDFETALLNWLNAFYERCCEDYRNR